MIEGHEATSALTCLRDAEAEVREVEAAMDELREHYLRELDKKDEEIARLKAEIARLVGWQVRLRMWWRRRRERRAMRKVWRASRRRRLYG
jgi:hypothetical protein